MKISVNSKVRLNGVGIGGAMLFVGSPLVGGFVYLNTAVTSLVFRGVINFTLFCSVVAMVGFVMLLVGREYDHKIEIERE